MAIAVAASGGRDSTALLHCTARSAAALGHRVLALHVHHGLHPDADAWCAHLRRQVQRWARAGLPVSLCVHRLAEAPPAGASVEAWARRERYAALAAMAQQAGCGTVLLAHHRRDQAETWLLQALRGGGAAALAAMPREVRRMGVLFLRPWLEQPREAVEAYVHRHRLAFVDDGSNADPRFARNRLRLQVWPALTQAFADAETTLAGAARRAAEAAEALRELAALDLADCVAADGALDRERWLLLSPARRAVVLRAWLAQQQADGVPETLVRRLLDELPAARSARWPFDRHELRCHDGRLTAAVAVPVLQHADAEQPALRLDLSSPGRHPVPAWQGTLVVVQVAVGGVAPAQLRAATLRPRAGGEQFQLSARGMPRALKKQFQARRIAAWQRGGPLVWAEDRLLFVPGLGLDARCVESAGDGLALHWEPDAPTDAGARPPPAGRRQAAR